MLAEAGALERDVAIPPVIQALLASRLEQLQPEERGLLGRASVEGESFHVGAVSALSAENERSHVRGTALGLVRKELVAPDRPTLPGEEAFRFRHALIRDAAYDALPKEERAHLHERYAHWLEETLGDHTMEVDEFLGYHLEQAYRYETELATPDGRIVHLASRAATHLQSAGRRALRRADLPAAIGLFDRTLALLPSDDPMGLELMPELAFALFFVGQHERGEAVATDAISAALSAGDRRTEAHAVVVRSVARMYLNPHTVDLDQVDRKLLGPPQSSMTWTTTSAGRAWVTFFSRRSISPGGPRPQPTQPRTHCAMRGLQRAGRTRSP